MALLFCVQDELHTDNHTEKAPTALPSLVREGGKTKSFEERVVKKHLPLSHGRDRPLPYKKAVHRKRYTLQYRRGRHSPPCLKRSRVNKICQWHIFSGK